MNRKIIILCLILMVVPSLVYGQNLISDQPAKASPADGDMIMGELADNSAYFHTTIAQLKASTFQPLDSELTTLAGLTYSANMQTFLAAADYAAMRTLLGLVIGTNVLAEQTIGIADDNLIEVDGSPNSGEVGIWTANGLDGNNEAEFKSAFSVGDEDHASRHQDTGADEIAVTTGMMNTGTGASAATYWRGDNTWATPAGAGDVAKVGTPANHEWGVWTGDGTLEGVAVSGSSVICTDADGEPVVCSNLTDVVVTGHMLESNIGTGANNYLQLSGSPGAPSGSKFLKDDMTWGVPAGGGDLLADGSTPLTDNWDVGAYTITALRFISDQATGTAPLTVASTTVVTNLNADLLDGESAAAFEDADATIIKQADVDDTPDDGDTTTPPSANWAFDLENSLGTASTRDAEDTLTDGENLPDGAAIKAYGDANWGGAGAGDLLADGSVPLTSNWDVGAYTITALRFISDQATGTAPLSVSSTTVVTNLNADTVDGESASAFEDADAAIVKSDEAETITTLWDFSNQAPTVPRETYDATNWNNDDGAATKNDIRDKIETMTGGDVTGPDPTVVDNAIALFDGTSGKIIKESSVTIDSDGVLNPNTAATDSVIGFYDVDGGGADLADKFAGEMRANFTTVTEDSEDGDVWLSVVMGGTWHTAWLVDASEKVIKTSLPTSMANRMVTADINAADYVVTTELGTNLEDWNGVTILAGKGSGTYDVVIPDCATSYNIGGVSTAVADFGAQITVCQRWISQTVSIDSASTGDDFSLRNGNNTDDDDEIDSPGAAQADMCVHLVCISSSNRWKVHNETGGTDAIDPSWVDSGASD